MEQADEWEVCALNNRYGNNDMRIHEWLYDVVREICHDREYIYLSFIQSFKALMDDIYTRGYIEDHGEHIVEGIKSGLRAEITWRLHHRVNYVGLNIVDMICVIRDRFSGEEQQKLEESFELSAGERV